MIHAIEQGIEGSVVGRVGLPKSLSSDHAPAADMCADFRRWHAGKLPYRQSAGRGDLYQGSLSWML